MSYGGHRRKKKFSLDRFFRKLISSSEKHEEDVWVPPAMRQPGSAPVDEEEQPRRRKKKTGGFSKWFWHRMERFAHWSELRREKRNKRRFLREMRQRHKRENKPVPFYKKLFNKYFEKEGRTYGYGYGYYGSGEAMDKEKVELRRQRRRLAFLSINSTIIFILTYMLAYFIYQLAVMFAASRYGINSILLYYEVYFPVGNYSDKWTSFNIIIITFAGPLISIIIGTICLLLFVRKENVTGLRKLFFFWLGFHCVNFFLGAFVGGTITQQGFGYVIAWMFLPTVVKFGISIVCLFVLGLVGFLYAPYFLEFSGSFFWLKKENKAWYVLFTAFIPWFISSTLISILRYPRVVPQHENILVYDSIIIATMVFVIAGLFVNFKAEPMIEKAVKKEGRRINWVYLVVMIGLLVLFRWGLNTGFYYLAP